MSVKEGRPREGLMMMQELDDRLKEQIDKLEHIRRSVGELKESMSESSAKDLKQSIGDHMDWLSHLTERVETLQMNTTVFVQMNTKPRSFKGKRGLRQSSRWGGSHLVDDAQSEYGWSPIRTRRNSDAASEMSCAW
ncbi:uncharacterized protein LOC143122691 isoform X2 [Alosa pseudoharengus]|uniref:uncharacterized protein LOC143122691 isoform X2 n=1 Tax=Alosa pseudoharengus TaxID=34774 RepID=UPI003F8CCEAE